MSVSTISRWESGQVKSTNYANTISTQKYCKRLHIPESILPYLLDRDNGAYGWKVTFDELIADDELSARTRRCWNACDERRIPEGTNIFDRVIKTELSDPDDIAKAITELNKELDNQMEDRTVEEDLCPNELTITNVTYLLSRLYNQMPPDVFLDIYIHYRGCESIDRTDILNYVYDRHDFITYSAVYSVFSDVHHYLCLEDN